MAVRNDLGRLPALAFLSLLLAAQSASAWAGGHAAFARLLWGLEPAPTAPATVYYGGDIITVAGKDPEYAEALVARGGRIAFVGSKAGALKAAGPGAALVDLKGRTLIPGLVDAHAHFVASSHTLLYAELGEAKTKDDIIRLLKAQAKTVAPGEWIEGWGYRSSTTGFPSKEDLDEVSTTQPVFAVDSSGHHASANSVLLKLMGYTKGVPNPEGGVIYRKEGTDEPSGHIAETATMATIARRPPLSKERIREGVRRATDVWLSNGFTTANELGVGLAGDDISVVREIIDEKLLPMDLVVYIKYAVAEEAAKAAKDVAQKYKPAHGQKYVNRVRAGGVKFWLDGSIPTALMRQPYAHLPEGVTDKNYKGVQVDPTRDLEKFVNRFWKSNDTVKIAAHALGDGAIEVLLTAYEKAAKAQGPTHKRHLIQHAAVMRPDQVARAIKLGVLPSFTAGSLMIAGDFVTYLFGTQLESSAMPAGSFQKANYPWSINTDYPAGAGPSLFLSMQDIVNRATLKGRVLGPEQRVTPYQALRAMTANAAYLHDEEKTKGTLEVGKLADLVILDRNPLKVDTNTIMNTRVMETIKEGRTVWKRPADGGPAPPTLSQAAAENGQMDTHEMSAPPGPLDAASGAAVNALLGGPAKA